MPVLVAAYLDYRSCDARDGLPTVEAIGEPTGTPSAGVSILEVELMDLFSKSLCKSCYFSNMLTVAFSSMKCYIGLVPWPHIPK